MPTKKKTDDDPKEKKTASKKSRSKSSSSKTKAKTSTTGASKSKTNSTNSDIKSKSATSGADSTFTPMTAKSYLSARSTSAGKPRTSAVKPSTPAPSVGAAGTGAGVLAAARAAVNSSRTNPSPVIGDVAIPNSSNLKALPPKAVETPPVERQSVRFSERQPGGEPETGAVKKILVFLVVVIAIGLGLLFVMERFIQNQASSAEENPTTVETITDPQYDFISIVTNPVTDTLAGTISENSSYTSDEISLGSEANSTDGLKLVGYSYTVYESFARTEFGFVGIKNGLPAIKVSMPEDTRISVQISNSDVERELLQNVEMKSGNVISIEGGQVDDQVIFDIHLREVSKVSVFIDSQNQLVIDIKTPEQLDLPTVEPEVEEPEVVEPEVTDPEPEVVEPEVTEPEPEIVEPEPTDPNTTSDMPEAPHYNNVKSQDKQYVVSATSGNDLISETYYYRDDVSSFLFSWAIRGPGNRIPNATAEYITVNGVDYIEVKINNLKYDLLHSSGKAKASINISTAGTPLMEVQTHDFSRGTATFRVKMSKKVDFKLHSTLTYNNYQLLTLQVFDR